MVWVPPGEFVMSSPDGEPRHRVRITRGFWIGKHEVTREQYRRFCDETGTSSDVRFDRDLANHPVWLSEREEAIAYCDRYGLRLPTVAEWEYAARGPEGSLYPWGNEWDSSKCCASGNRGSHNTTWPVGSFPEGASWCGALDMAGNAWEFCADVYDADSYGGYATTDPRGPRRGGIGMATLRGGSWYTGSYACRSIDPGDEFRRFSGLAYVWLGFRVCPDGNSDSPQTPDDSAARD